jgi:imidazole glycerol-phosphate synthase subunit HisH
LDVGTAQSMVTIVDYGVGNLASIANMVRKAGTDGVVSSDPAVVAAATKLILPGVGAFDRGMANLEERGLIPALNERVLGSRVPTLGLCLGMQLLGRGSEEGTRPGLGWLAAHSRRFKFPADSALKVPHMGWNFIEPALRLRSGHATPAALVNNLPAEPRFYFVHSYYLACDHPDDVMCWTTYGGRFASGIHHGNLWGTQFHPEKSHSFGLALLRNFLALP